MTISIPVTHPIHKVLSMDITDTVNRYHHSIINEVSQHVSENYIVVVGMAWNDVVKKIDAWLTSNEYSYTNLEYGSYSSLWKERLSIRMWSGCGTFPQLFVQSILIGGFDDQKALIEKESISTVVRGWSL